MAERAPDEPMTTTEFLDWAAAQHRGRFELLDGEIHAMSPERVSHNETKQLAWLALREAIARPAVQGLWRWSDGQDR